MGNVVITKTLSPENEFRIRCPVFAAETKIADCFKLRDLVWRGEGPLVRQGCQCALIAGKCPIPVILTKMFRLKDDPYHSAEPKVGALDPEILDQTSSITITDTTMRRFALSPQEQKKLVEANENARSGQHQKQVKPRRQERVLEEMETVAETKVDVDQSRTVDTKTDAIVEAAKSGDLSAAITAEAVATEENAA